MPRFIRIEKNNSQIQLELGTAWLQLISVLLVSSSDQRKDRRPSLILSIGPQTAAQHKIMLAILGKMSK